MVKFGYKYNFNRNIIIWKGRGKGTVEIRNDYAKL